MNVETNYRYLSNFSNDVERNNLVPLFLSKSVSNACTASQRFTFSSANVQIITLVYAQTLLVSHAVY
jgi:hypothetical protein